MSWFDLHMEIWQRLWMPKKSSSLNRPTACTLCTSSATVPKLTQVLVELKFVDKNSTCMCCAMLLIYISIVCKLNRCAIYHLWIWTVNPEHNIQLGRASRRHSVFQTNHRMIVYYSVIFLLNLSPLLSHTFRSFVIYFNTFKYYKYFPRLKRKLGVECVRTYNTYIGLVTELSIGCIHILLFVALQFVHAHCHRSGTRFLIMYENYMHQLPNSSP